MSQELTKNVMFLECDLTTDGGSCHVYLVGTYHISMESCREVKAIMRHLKPQVVYLELCEKRVALLYPQSWKAPTVDKMIDVWKNKENLFGILHSWFIAKVAGKLNIIPCAKFSVAFEEARSYGARVILGDRPIQKQKVNNLFPSEFGLVKRFWRYLLNRESLDGDTQWASVPNNCINSIALLLKQCPFKVVGKGQFKDEFFTAGGVPL